MAILNTRTGYYGFTIDITGNSSDSNGDTNTCIFAINYPLQSADVNFNISTGAEDWAAQMGDGSIVPLSQPDVIFQNRDNSIVQFKMETGYPSNSPCFLVYRSDTASMSVTARSENRPFEVNSVCGYFAYTIETNDNELDNGYTKRLQATIPYPVQSAGVNFVISSDPSHWGVRMGDGSIISLRDPNVLYSNQDNAVVQFVMDTPYPSNSPGVLVYRSPEAVMELQARDGDETFVPIIDVIGMPDNIVANVPFNLNEMNILPYNASVQTMVWEVVSGPAVVNNNILTGIGTGKVSLRVTIPKGLSSTTGYTKSFEVNSIQNEITIISQPVSNINLKLNQGGDKLTVNATSLATDNIKYQWYKNTTKSTEGGTEILNETSSSYSVPYDKAGHTYYYCKLSAEGARDVFTNICDVYVMVEIKSISIANAPTKIQIGETYTLQIQQDPPEADTPKVLWSSSDVSIATIDKDTGEIIALDEGTVTFTAVTVDGKLNASCKVTVPKYISVTDITDLVQVMETATDTTLTGSVLPVNANAKTIEWSIVDAGSTGAVINGNTIRAVDIGSVLIRATVKKGISINQDYIRDFYVTVNKKFIPVSDIELTNYANITAGETILLKANVIPDNATNNNVVFSINSAGTTGATLNGDLLTVASEGVVTINAIVIQGMSESKDYTKTFTINVAGEWIAVEGITDMPNNFDSVDVPLKLTGKVFPENASMQDISYKIKSNPLDKYLTLTSDNTLVIDYENVTWWNRNPTPTPPDYFDQWLPNITDPIEIEMTVKDGIKPGTDFTAVSSINITLPASPDVFIPVSEVEMGLPSIVRAHRPILMTYTRVRPFNATGQNVITDIIRPDDPEELGGMGCTFYPIHEDFSYWDELYHIDFNEDYDWYREAHYTYLFEDGVAKFTYIVPNGVEVKSAAEDANWYGTNYVEFLPAYMKVDHISNIPDVIYANGKDDTYILDPLCHTNISVPITNTSMFDVDIPSYTDIKWSISDEGTTTGTSITEDGVITIGPEDVGKKFTIRAQIENGLQEEYTWYDLEFENIPYIEEFKIIIKEDPNKIFGVLPEEPEIPEDEDPDEPGGEEGESPDTENPDGEKGPETIAAATPLGIDIPGSDEGDEDDDEEDEEEEEDPNACDPLIILTLSDERVIPVRWLSQLTKLSNSMDDTFEITIGKETFTKADIVEVQFWNSESRINVFPTSLRRFGCNFTSLTVINEIPESVTGDECLMYFLEGCTSFNQDITIPETVSGDECLHAFLKGCTEFNSIILIENDNLAGNGVMKRFLVGCTSFDQEIVLPSALTGDHCLRRFMEGCTSFNQPLTIPEGVCGDRCLDHFLFNCTSFNQDITIPDALDGNSNMRAFMRNTWGMTSTITISEEAAEKCEVNGLSFGCFARNKDTFNEGVKIAGTGADKLKEKLPSMTTTLPIRKIL